MTLPHKKVYLEKKLKMLPFMEIITSFQSQLLESQFQKLLTSSKQKQQKQQSTSQGDSLEKPFQQLNLINFRVGPSQCILCGKINQKLENRIFCTLAVAFTQLNTILISYCNAWPSLDKRPQSPNFNNRQHCCLQNSI